jgi:hypothetical protein
VERGRSIFEHLSERLLLLAVLVTACRVRVIQYHGARGRSSGSILLSMEAERVTICGSRYELLVLLVTLRTENTEYGAHRNSASRSPN